MKVTSVARSGHRSIEASPGWYLREGTEAPARSQGLGGEAIVKRVKK